MSRVIERVAFRILRPLASSRCLDASLRVAADQLWGAAEYALSAGHDDDHQQLHSIACAVFSVINTLEPETQRMELLELLKHHRLVAEQPTKPQAIAA